MPRTVLLWGNRWWLPHQSSPIVFGDLATAADALAAAWPGDDRTIRLVFQPDALASTYVSCPHANRGTLALALAESFPALADSRHAWSHEPILPAGEGFSTLLHYETEPALFALIARLHERGFVVTGAWPLATWLNALPSDLAESGSTTIAVVAEDRVSLYCDAVDGKRSAVTWKEAQSVCTLEAFVRERFEADAGSRVLLVTAGEAVLPSLASFSSLGERLHHLTLADALAAPAPLAARHPAQLLPTPARLSASRLMVAASIMFLLAATALGFRFAVDYTNARADATSLEREKRALRAEVARLHSSAAEISHLRALLAAVHSSPPAAAFCRKLSTTIPHDIVLRSLHLTPQELVVAGWINPRASHATGQGWTTRLGSESWQLSGPWAADVSGAFRLAGSWR